MTYLWLLISISSIILILLLIYISSLRHTINIMKINKDLQTHVILEYDLYKKILEEKINESYDIVFVRDISVYINNNENIDEKDFHGLAISFCKYFEKLCGEPVYNRLIILFGGHENLISYLTLKFNRLIVQTKVKRFF